MWTAIPVHPDVALCLDSLLGELVGQSEQRFGKATIDDVGAYAHELANQTGLLCRVDTETATVVWLERKEY